MDEGRALQKAGFRCPLCGSRTYSAVEITLKNGTRLRADFYHCTECSLHFVHPERFTDAVADAPEPVSAATASP
jgi:DNA-directed RNA polymerase subunit RPC12/RpoP